MIVWDFVKWLGKLKTLKKSKQTDFRMHFVRTSLCVQVRVSYFEPKLIGTCIVFLVFSCKNINLHLDIK